MINNNRNSTYELLRIIAMFFIVFYHIVCSFLYTYSNVFGEKILSACLPALHVGVVLFVLISGYFGINFSWRGLLRILVMVAIYYIPLEIVNAVIDCESWTDAVFRFVRVVDFVSYTPYWFVRTYLLLYVMSPMLNLYWDSIDGRGKWYVLGVLCFISCFIGNSFGWNGLEDDSLEMGKNIVNFTFVYFLGRMLKARETEWLKWKTVFVFFGWVLLNVGVFVILLMLPYEGGWYNWLMCKTFRYNSVLLLVNATLLFMLVSKMNIQSKCVNSIAGSMFAVYLIHCQPRIEHKVIDTAVAYIGDRAGEDLWILVCCLFALSLAVMVICVGVDKCFTPLWELVKKIGEYVDKRRPMNL